MVEARRSAVFHGRAEQEETTWMIAGNGTRHNRWRSETGNLDRPVTGLVPRAPSDETGRMSELAASMSGNASASPALGKIVPEAFERLIAPHLGATRSEVLVGPGLGRDGAIVKVGAGRVIAVTTDPLSLVPALGPEASARLSCHLLASD